MCFIQYPSTTSSYSNCWTWRFRYFILMFNANLSVYDLNFFLLKLIVLTQVTNTVFWSTIKSQLDLLIFIWIWWHFHEFFADTGSYILHCSFAYLFYRRKLWCLGWKRIWWWSKPAFVTACLMQEVIAHYALYAILTTGLDFLYPATTSGSYW